VSGRGAGAAVFCLRTPAEATLKCHRTVSVQRLDGLPIVSALPNYVCQICSAGNRCSCRRALNGLNLLESGAVDEMMKWTMYVRPISVFNSF
jgi:hypothetical protein